MIKESYIANWHNLPSDALKVRVARPSVLAPSKDLLAKWKAGKMSWLEYEAAFSEEIRTRKEAALKLDSLATLAMQKDVYLICYEKDPKYCHRSILLGWIDWIMKGKELQRGRQLT